IPKKIQDGQIRTLRKVKRERSNAKVADCLSKLKDAAADPAKNVVPAVMDAVGEMATVGEVTAAFEAVFGAYVSQQ
ncbi:MAG: methylmalonyl-CoA mutase family protein, partial [Elusimicrobiota bacterium]